MPAIVLNPSANTTLERARSDPDIARTSFIQLLPSVANRLRLPIRTVDEATDYYFALPPQALIRQYGVLAGVTVEIFRSVYAAWLASLEPQGHGGAFGGVRDLLSQVVASPGGAIWLAAVAATFGAGIIDAPGAGAASAAPVAVSSTNQTGAAVASSSAAVAGSVAGNQATSAAAAAAAEGSIASSVIALVRDVQSALAPIVNTVADAVRSVRDVVVAINDGILQPIIRPIQETQRTVESLIRLIEEDRKRGLEGLLRIPQDIANAFTSLDATMQRAAQMLSAGMSDQLAARLMPGLQQSGSKPLGELREAFQIAFPGRAGSWTPPPIINLETGPSLEEFKKYVREQQELLTADESLPAMFFNLLFKAVGVLEGLIVQRAPYVEIWREEVFRQAGHVRFDVGTALDLYSKNIITRAMVEDELRSSGYSESRARALIESVRRIPQDGQALDWFYRGLIDEPGLRAVLDVNNWSAADQQKVIDASRKQLSAADIVSAWQRGFLDDEQATLLLREQGWRDDLIRVIRAVAFAPLGVGAAIDSGQRFQLLRNSGLFTADEQTMPTRVLDAAQASAQSITAAQAAWDMHWNILPPNMAVDGYFRGFFTESQLEQYLDAWGIPRAMQRNYIDLRRPRVPYRTVTTLINQGIIERQRGIDILRSYGYREEDVLLLVETQSRSSGAPSEAEADQFAGLTQGIILDLYEAGTIERDAARELLVHIGKGEGTADSILDLTDLKIAAEQRAGEIDFIVAQAGAGNITEDDAIGLLGGIGATSAEINRAMAKIASANKAGTKMPGEGSILDMYKAGIIERAAAADALQLIGYSAGWAELLIQLKESRGSQPQ